MRQIYNVESPPSSMLFDTSALEDGTGSINMIATNATVTAITNSFAAISTSNGQNPSEPHSNLNLMEQAQYELYQKQMQQQQLQTNATNMVANARNSPSRLLLANLIPSRFASFIISFIKFSFYL